MKEKRPANGTEKFREPHLPEKTRAFVQHAFACGAAEKLDQRKRSLLTRYVADDELTLEKLRPYAGVNHVTSVWKLYTSALKTLWHESSKDIQQNFPKEEVVRGKRTGPRGWAVPKADYLRRYYQKNKERIKKQRRQR